MWTPEYFVRYIDLPLKVDGVTLPNNDGTFDIYINARHSAEHQAESLAHELWHITHNHFYNEQPVADCERDAKHAAKSHHKPQDGFMPCSSAIPLSDAETRARGNVARI